MSSTREPDSARPPAGDDEDELAAVLAETLRARDADDPLTREQAELILPGVPFS